MDGSRFDALTRAVTTIQKTSRRQNLKLLAGGSAWRAGGPVLGERGERGLQEQRHSLHGGHGMLLRRL